MSHPLARYRSVVDDWPAFARRALEPLPTTVWTNTLRTDQQRLRRWLEREGMSATPIGWNPGALRLEVGAVSVPRTLAHITGLCHIQEEAAMTAVELLAPEPNERLLELCAAPGNKSLQMAVRIADRGTMVAVDRHSQRLGVLVRNAERLGITSCVVTVGDAASLSAGIGSFDRVLADVPCSCEGTSRKNAAVIERLDRRRDDDPGWLRTRRVQRAILEKAVQRCRPGGRIVYATCTYAPEENEAIVSSILDAYPELTVIPARLPGLTTRPGLTSWRDADYHPAMTGAMRLYPHDNDTGGFFAAVLEKAGSNQ
ncbi:MAG: RsmB/NOP family class I SAM-dependent RNA methyltransferase [Acidobacteriota bacterium]